MCSVASLPPVSVPSVPRGSFSANEAGDVDEQQRRARDDADGATTATRCPTSPGLTGVRRRVLGRRRCGDRRAGHGTRRARSSMSRGIVEASPYSQASSRKPGGGARFVHVVDQQTHLTHHLYVSAQGAVHEGQVDPGGHFLDGRVVPEVRTDPPVLLLEDVVVDPAAPRSLEQRVVQEEEAAARRARGPGPSRGSRARTGRGAR